MLISDWSSDVCSSDLAANRAPSSIEEYSVGDPLTDAEERKRFWTTAYYLGWMVGYVALIGIVSLPVASAVFLGAFLRLEGRMSYPFVGLSVAALVAALFAVTYLLHLRWPTSLIGWLACWTASARHGSS